jgi:hypothetical protein
MDVNGNHEISSGPYSGTGESFTITPLYGQHKFEPNNCVLGKVLRWLILVLLIILLFSFKGTIVYDTRGYFLPCRY